MNAKRAAAAALFATIAAAGFAAGAQAPQAASPRSQPALEEAITRLGLTTEQAERLEPLVRERADALADIRDRYAGEDSRRARRAMFREAGPVIENYFARVRTLLKEPQYPEWEKMRAEARNRLDEQYDKGGFPE